jgi:hypothetical protein
MCYATSSLGSAQKVLEVMAGEPGRTGQPAGLEAAVRQAHKSIRYSAVKSLSSLYCLNAV